MAKLYSATLRRRLAALGYELRGGRGHWEIVRPHGPGQRLTYLLTTPNLGEVQSFALGLEALEKLGPGWELVYNPDGPRWDLRRATQSTAEADGL